MPHEQQPTRPGAINVDPKSVPDEARGYLATVEHHKQDPFVQKYYRQVAWLRVGASVEKVVDLFLIEFRDGLNTAFIWQAPDGNWGAGPWIRVAHLDADVTCPPSQFSWRTYFLNVQANPHFAGAVRVLEASRPR